MRFRTLLGLLGSGVLVVGGMAAAGFKSIGSVGKANGGDHVCHGNHYLENAATSSKLGNAEYYICCECKEKYDSLPSGEGVWNDISTGIGAEGDIDPAYVLYYVAFDKQGGEGGDDGTGLAQVGKNLPDIAAPSKEHYSFTGYYSLADGGDKYIDADGKGVKLWDKTESTSLYAHFEGDAYTINYFDKGEAAFSGAHEEGAPTQHIYGTATTLKGATKGGYTFGGWFLDSACTGTPVTSLEALGYTSAINLYALWTANTYSVAFDVDGGVAKQAVNYTVGAMQIISLGTATTTEHCKVFGGWTVTTQATGGDATISEQNLTIPAGAYGDIVVKVTWNTVHESVMDNFCLACYTLTANIVGNKNKGYEYKENFAQIRMASDSDFKIIFSFSYEDGYPDSAVDGMWGVVGGANINTDFYVKMRPDWWADVVSGQVYKPDGTTLVTGDNNLMERGSSGDWEFNDFKKAKAKGHGTWTFKYKAETQYFDCFQDYTTDVSGMSGSYRVWYHFKVKFGSGTAGNPIYVKLMSHWVIATCTKIEIPYGSADWFNSQVLHGE